MSLVNCKLSLMEGLHQFPPGVFGSSRDLIDPRDARTEIR